MKIVLALCLLAAAVTAAPQPKEGDISSGTSDTSLRVQEILEQALQERPKTTRQLFPAERRTRRGQERIEQTEESAEDKREDVHGGSPSAVGLGQEDGWSPLALSGPPTAQGRSVDTSDLAAEDTSSGDESSSPSEEEEEGGTAADSYLSPLYAPAPGGYGGHGYGGYGPYIYIVPVVLPPPGAAGHHGGPVGRHVVTETGHESHHYSSGGGTHYQPVYAGSYGVPPIYIPKIYGAHHGGPPGVPHGALHGAHHGKHGGHTTVHHEDKTIIRDIEPPVFKA